MEILGWRYHHPRVDCLIIFLKSPQSNPLQYKGAHLYLRLAFNSPFSALPSVLDKGEQTTTQISHCF